MTIITTAGCQLHCLKSSLIREAFVICLPADFVIQPGTHARTHARTQSHTHTHTHTHTLSLSLSLSLSLLLALGTGVLILIVRGDVDTRPADQCQPAVAALSVPTGIPAGTAANATENVTAMAARPASTGRLVLAGEATSVTHPATAHGAFLSGACDVPSQHTQHSCFSHRS